MIEATRNAVRQHAEAVYPRECCGVVIVRKGRERYVPCENVAATPFEHFVIKGQDFAAAEDQGEVVAIVHSHPDASADPSEADRVQCETHGLEWHIVSVREGVAGEIVSFKPSGFRAPLVGRSFSHGILDCYTLVQDYYRQEVGIELPYFERRDGWWDIPGVSLYMDNFAACGFVPVKGPLQVGDVILMQIRSLEPNHAAVYIGDGQILHHFMGRLSSRDVYDGYWQEHTRIAIRYKGT